MSDSSETSMAQSTQSGGGYTVIARRYRPQAFEELVGQEHVARALQQAIASGRVGHAYLFTGARGVGKTSAARILAKALNCVHGPTPTPCNRCDVCQRVSTGDDVDVLEIDGASNNTVDEVRDLRQNVAVRPSRTRFKIYIIDEVHMLSKSAFNALLKTLEEPPEHVKFIFATTEAHKIPITILSRCQRFDFAGIDAAAIQTRLTQIAAAEGVEIEPAAVQILSSRAAGSMRDSQSLLEQLLAVSRERITAADVNSLLGIAAAERISGLVRHLVARDAAAAMTELDLTLRDGVDPGLLLDQLVGYFRDAMALAVGCRPDQMLYALPSQADEVAEASRQLGLQTILAIGQILDHTAARTRVSMHGRILIEIAIARICSLGDLDELANLVAELRGQGSGELALVASSTPAEVAKKNAEPQPTKPLSEALAKHEAGASSAPRTKLESQGADVRYDSPHPVNPTAQQNGVTAGSVPAAESSVLAQWQRAITGEQQAAAVPAPARVSRREQLAAIAEEPLVRRAMELFDVQPGQLRYTPPENSSD
jgi:DNA polymerase-3 subunit gamma/tau